MELCVFEKKEIEMQQSSECDSSGRVCLDSDEIASTYSCSGMFIRAHMCIRCAYVPC